MGSCVSVHKNSESAIELPSSISSKAKDNNLPIESPIGDLGSKEETFFDSQPWLESDCEDFFSVNGDTPSRGNTPIHECSLIQTPQLDNNCLPIDTRAGSLCEPSATDNNNNMKKLADFFSDSFSENENPDDNQTILDLPTTSTNGARNMSKENSVCSREMTEAERVSKPDKQKLSRSVSCCLPSLGRSLSFNDRKKRLSTDDSFGR